MYDEQPQAASKPVGHLSLALSALASLLLHASVAAWAAQQSLQRVIPLPFEVELVTLSTPESAAQEEPDRLTPTPQPPHPQSVALKPDLDHPHRSDAPLGLSASAATPPEAREADEGPEEPPAPTPTAPPPDFARYLPRELPDDALPRNAPAKTLAVANSYGTGGKNSRPEGASDRTQGSQDLGIGKQRFVDEQPGTDPSDDFRASLPSGTGNEVPQEASNTTHGSGLGGNRLEVTLEVPGPLSERLAQGRLTSPLAPSPLFGPVDAVAAPGPLKDAVKQAATASAPNGPTLIQSGLPSPPLDTTAAKGAPPAKALRPSPPPPKTPGDQPLQAAKETLQEPLKEASPKKSPEPSTAPQDVARVQARMGLPSGVAAEAPERPSPTTLLAPHRGASANGSIDSDQTRNRRARQEQDERRAASRQDEPTAPSETEIETMVASIPVKGPTGSNQDAVQAQSDSRRGILAVPELKGEKTPPDEPTGAERSTQPPPTPPPRPDPVQVREDVRPAQPPPTRTPEGPPDPARQRPTAEHPEANTSAQDKPLLPRRDASSPVQHDQDPSGGTVSGFGVPEGEKGLELLKQKVRTGILEGAAAPGLENPDVKGRIGEDRSGLGKRDHRSAGASELVSGSQVAAIPRVPRFDAASNLDTQESKYWQVSSEVQRRLDRELKNDVYSIRRLSQEGLVTFCLQIHANGKVSEGEIWPVDGMDQEVLVASGDRALRAILKHPLTPFPREWDVDVLLMKVEINFHMPRNMTPRRKSLKCEQRAVGGAPPKLKSPSPPQPVKPLPGMPRIDIDQPDILLAPGRPLPPK